MPPFPFGLERCASLEYDVRLLLAVPRVVVLGIPCPVRRQPQDVHAPCRDADAPSRVQKLAWRRGRALVALEFIEALHGYVSHASSRRQLRQRGCSAP